MTKGLSQTMWIVIGIVVFLVVALVILTIFGTSVGTFASVAEATAFCENQAATSCVATSNMPATWTALNIKTSPTASDFTSCEIVTGRSAC